MEVITRRPASPPSLPRRGEFRFDDSVYATAPCSPHRRLPSLTAPPSPDPFDLLPPPSDTPRHTGANPFDLFQHFTSAPASPRRAAAIYAHFADANRDDGAHEDDKDDDEEEFQQRSSYSTAASAVPFDWEETPGTPKAGIGMGGAPAWDDTDAEDTGDFEFGTVVDKAAPAESTLTTADELFEKGRIRPLKPLMKTPSDMSDKGSSSGKMMRPLKPPPGLLDGGGPSGGSSPRSPMAVLRSPRRRSRVGSGTDFDPFAAALLEASKAAPVPSLSPLGTTKEANGMVKPKTMTASKSAGWRRWRLSDLLLFRSSSEGGRINRDSVFRCSPAKANGKVGSVDDKPKMKQGGAAVADGVVGCARLSPLQRLARGLGGHSWHHGRGMAATGTKG